MPQAVCKTCIECLILKDNIAFCSYTILVFEFGQKKNGQELVEVGGWSNRGNDRKIL